ncbi:MAG: ATP-binding protein [Bacteroidota bacterium]
MEHALVLHNAHWNNKKYAVKIKRELLESLKELNSVKEIQIITGLRRSGKSSIMKLYINWLMETEDPKSLLFVNLDDPSFSEIYTHPAQFHKLIEAAETMTGVKVKYLLIDEIQNVKGWEKYIKSVYDAERFKKICISGSNSSLLNSDYSALLSGRYVLHQLFPLSIDEILDHYNLNDRLRIKQNQPKVNNILTDALKSGCFPEIVLQKKNSIKHEILTSYYDSIIIKDCIINKELRDHRLFKEIAYYIFNNTASLYSYHSLSKALNVNDITIKEYINAMKDAYLIYEIPQFDYKLKKQIKSRRKLYSIDSGLINTVSLNFSENKGNLFENMVFAELKKAGVKEIFVLNDTKECDFIIRYNNVTCAIQASYELTTSNKAREVSGLLYAHTKYNIDKSFIVTFSQSYTIENGITVVPVYALRSNIE